MNKHMRLLFAALFIVIIILAAAITRFYSHTDKNIYDGGAQSVIAKKLDSDSGGYFLFQDISGKYGAADSSDRVVVSPDWDSLQFTDSALLKANKQIHGSMLTGCIDYEGDIVIPLIYDSIDKISCAGLTFYAACAHDDGSYVIYNSNFEPCFTKSWKKCRFSENELTLYTDKGTYIYSVSDSGFTMKKAMVSGNTMSHDYELDITSKLLLSKLTVPMLEDMTEAAGKYIEYAFTGDAGCLDSVNTSENALFTQLFPNESRIKSKKLNEVPDIFLYAKRSDDNIPHFAVSMTVSTNIVYTDDNNKAAQMDGKYTAVIEFSGGSAGELNATLGSFKEESPEYPAPEPEHPAIGENSDTEGGYTAGEEPTTEAQTMPVTTVQPTTEITYF